MKLSIIPFILTKLKQGLGIVQDTDTATQAIAKDKYVFWKGSLKKSSSAISQNDTLSASNLSDVSEGALNELAEQIGNIVKSVSFELTLSANGNADFPSSVPSNAVILSISAYKKNDTVCVPCIPYVYSTIAYPKVRGLHAVSESIGGSVAGITILCTVYYI